MKKRAFNFLLIVVLFILLAKEAYALGISPAIVELDFNPGEKVEIDYIVTADNIQQIRTFVKGDLAEYVKLSKDELTGSGSFKALISLPPTLGKPGKHTISIGVEEVPGREGAIGAVVRVIAVANVFMPYPGKYAEATLNIPDGNVGESIPVEVSVINRGSEGLNVGVNVFIFDGNRNQAGSVPFSPEFISSGQEKIFKEFINTAGYKPGSYMAEAKIEYGEELALNRTFRIGSLFVNISNFTQKLPKDGIQRFVINIESMWNDNIGEVFADVNISNDAESITFRTPSVKLNAWENKMLEGFLDTEELEGEYDSEIVLNYLGGQTVANGKLKVSKLSRAIVIVIVAAAIILLAALYLFIRNRKKFKHKNK